MTKNEVKSGKVYKNKVLFLRKSKSGSHLYAFNREKILGEGIDALLINISEIEPLIEGKFKAIKISALPVNEESSAEKTGEEKDGKK